MPCLFALLGASKSYSVFDSLRCVCLPVWTWRLSLSRRSGTSFWVWRSPHLLSRGNRLLRLRSRQRSSPSSPPPRHALSTNTATKSSPPPPATTKRRHSLPRQNGESGVASVEVYRNERIIKQRYVVRFGKTLQLIANSSQPASSVAHECLQTVVGGSSWTPRTGWSDIVEMGYLHKIFKGSMLDRNVHYCLKKTPELYSNLVLLGKVAFGKWVFIFVFHIQSHFCCQLALANKPHLCVIWRHQRDWLHLHSAQECSQEVYLHLRPTCSSEFTKLLPHRLWCTVLMSVSSLSWENEYGGVSPELISHPSLSDCWLPVWREPPRQPPGEGDPLHRDGTSVGHAPDRTSSQSAAWTRVPQGI